MCKIWKWLAIQFYQEIFLSFAKNIGKNIGNNKSKNLSSKCSQKYPGCAKKSDTDALKNASKRAIHKTVEATGDLVDNKISNHHKILHKWLIVKQKYRKKDIFLQKKDRKLLRN